MFRFHRGQRREACLAQVRGRKWKKDTQSFVIQFWIFASHLYPEINETETSVLCLLMVLPFYDSFQSIDPFRSPIDLEFRLH